MADAVGQSHAGVPHQISNLLQLAGGHKDIVAGIMQAARVQPAAVASLLVQILQQDEVSARQKVAAYKSFRTGSLEQGMEAGLIGSLIAVASQQMRAAPEEASIELQAAASDTLAHLAGSYFGPVMRELQKHLRPFVLPAEFTLLTLGKVMAASVYRCVPFLGITLTTMQTVMRGIDDSRRRGAFCTALECMCGAISTYLRSWERSSYPQITLQRFSAYLLPMYRYLISAWLPSEDTEVKLAVLKALGPMLNILLPRKDLQNQIYGDIPLLLAQYGKNIEAFYITKVLGEILQASSSNNPIPEMYVEAISHTLSYQVTSKVQRPYRLCRENYTEISHVFLQLGKGVVSELLVQHRTAMQLQGLWVWLPGPECDLLPVAMDSLPRAPMLRWTDTPQSSAHSDAEVPGMASLKHLCIKSVKSVLTDGSPTERPIRSLPLGGLLEKVVQKTSLATLEIIIASGRGISQELWERLLGCVTRTSYTDSLTPLCRCLRVLATKRQQHRQAARDCRDPGHSKFSLDQTAWEHKLLEFLRKTLGRSKEGGWSQDLSQELIQQIGSYASASVEKAFLYKALGTALAMSRDVASVTGQLRTLLSMADYLNGAEMECLGSCLQLCAREQLDATLRALGDFEDEIAEGEDSWHLNLRKGQASQERDRVGSALLLFYSSAAAQASPQQLLPQLADKIVPKILHHYSTSSQVSACRSWSQSPCHPLYPLRLGSQGLTGSDLRPWGEGSMD
ncbi:maestro heat-like repeat-containing protein family member 2A [Gopherus flavomarginatus]|uniref:maestro heat-like repeat-containing protein family member 2A n=1 Tax=Gopherus flavomarginatus TaxID=286002 RepID=UPI0021CBD04C|nr:maestro heat-like repeat-containing protein family member 2A [Gopherus flavomarginatus]